MLPWRSGAELWPAGNAAAQNMQHDTLRCRATSQRSIHSQRHSFTRSRSRRELSCGLLETGIALIENELDALMTRFDRVPHTHTPTLHTAHAHAHPHTRTHTRARAHSARAQRVRVCTPRTRVRALRARDSRESKCCSGRGAPVPLGLADAGLAVLHPLCAAPGHGTGQRSVGPHWSLWCTGIRPRPASATVARGGAALPRRRSLTASESVCTAAPQDGSGFIDSDEFFHVISLHRCRFLISNFARPQHHARTHARSHRCAAYQ